MSDEGAIQVNFGRPMPLFPLDTAVLLPQQVLPLHVFEPRYRQMVERALDGAGQFAMAIFHGTRWRQEYHARPPLRPAVCVAQIVQHERLAEGKFNLLLQGLCRARIVEEVAAAPDRLYREARLEPMGEEEDEESLRGVRERLVELLEEQLGELGVTAWVLDRVRTLQIPTSVVLELVSFTIISDAELRYRLLAEASGPERAAMILDELREIAGTLRMAARQRPVDWPKGMSWN